MAILLAAASLAVVAVRWADREFLAAEPLPESPPLHSASRPGWVWPLHRPYRRVQHDGVWFAAAATLGVGALLARDGRIWDRRGLSRPGAAGVLVALLVGGGAVAHQLLAGRPLYTQAAGACYDLRNALDLRLPGAVLGAWIVAWLGWLGWLGSPRRRRRRPDWRERAARAVGWLWLADAGLLIAYALFFG